MGKEKDIALVLAMLLAPSTATASTLCEIVSPMLNYEYGTTIAVYGMDSETIIQENDVVENYSYEVAMKPKRVIKNVRLNIVSMKKGKLDTPNYLFEDITLYD